MSDQAICTDCGGRAYYSMDPDTAVTGTWCCLDCGCHHEGTRLDRILYCMGCGKPKSVPTECTGWQCQSCGERQLAGKNIMKLSDLLSLELENRALC